MLDEDGKANNHGCLMPQSTFVCQFVCQLDLYNMEAAMVSQLHRGLSTKFTSERYVS